MSETPLSQGLEAFNVVFLIHSWGTLILSCLLSNRDCLSCVTRMRLPSFSLGRLAGVIGTIPPGVSFLGA